MYCINEIEGGTVSSFAIAEACKILLLQNTQASGGTHPCHIHLDASGKFAYVANYGSGSAAVFPIVSSGLLEPAIGRVQHEGTANPHAHFICTDHKGHVYVTDLGLDKIMIYKKSKAGSLIPNVIPGATTAPGAGPRHLAFHPTLPYLYVINELHSTITVYDYDADTGNLHEVESVSTLPAGYDVGLNTGAHIQVHPNGRFLYASNRGHNSIAIFEVASHSGTLNLLSHESTQGDSPRHFTLNPQGSHLLAANQNSNSVVSFEVNQETGLLTPTGVNLHVPAPVCILIP